MLQYDLCTVFVFQPALKDGAGGSSGGVCMQLIMQGEGGLQELARLM